MMIDLCCIPNTTNILWVLNASLNIGWNGKNLWLVHDQNKLWDATLEMKLRVLRQDNVHFYFRLWKIS